MPALATLERLLWWASTLLSVSLLLRLCLAGLCRSYGALACLLLLEATRFVVSLFLEGSADAYAWLFLVTEPLVWLLHTLVVLQLYGQILRHHPGLRRVGRAGLVTLLSLCLAVSGLTTLMGAGAAGEAYPVLYYYGVAERIVCFSLVLFLALATAMLAWFPIALSRNALAICAGLSLLFVGRTALLLLPTLTGRRVPPEASAAMLALTGLCYGVWLLWLGREGERREVVLGHVWRPEERTRLLGQLSAMNEGLLRLSRR